MTTRLKQLDKNSSTSHQTVSIASLPIVDVVVDGQGGGDGEAPLAVGKRNSPDGAIAGAPIEGQKRKTRRARRWKPYHKLSVEEKKALEQREEIRAEQSRARRFAHGRPMAPYNTTQFLLEDREIRTTADWEETSAQRQRGMSESEMGNASETASGSHSDEVEDIEFETEYNSVNAERLEALSKDELVLTLLRREAECDAISNENRQLRAELVSLRQRLEQHNQ